MEGSGSVDKAGVQRCGYYVQLREHLAFRGEKLG